MIVKKENDILVRFYATPDNEIVVQGFGKNEFGTFSLSGKFNPETKALDLYRAYQPRSVDSSKKSKKKKSAPSTPGGNPTPKRPSRATPVVSQTWDATSIVSGPAAAVSQRARRPPSHVLELGEEENKIKARMLPVLESLMSQDKFKFFHFAVDPVRDGIPHYADIVTEPMDLGTVKKKLMSGQYENEEQMSADINLTFSNAMLFNPVGHAVYESARTLLTKFEMEFAKIIARRETERERKRKSLAAAQPPSNKNGKRSKLTKSASMRSDDSHYSDDESYDSDSNTMMRQQSRSSRRSSTSMDQGAVPGENEELRLLRKQVEMMSKQLESLQQVAIQSQRQPAYSQHADPSYTASAPKRPRAAPKPKPAPASAAIAADSGMDYEDDYVARAAPKQERPLSYQEKRALSQDINKLPGDKVQRVLDIIAESGSQMIGDGAEEVEIDIEKLDTVTLKALQKYVRDVLRTEKKKAIQGM